MKKARFFNRELSWLEFNQRILELAGDPRVPVLERLKFLCISCSNLDEFFMVRVGGLQTLVQQGNRKTDPAELDPRQQLDAVCKRAHAMALEQEACFAHLEKLLHHEGIRRVRGAQFDQEQHDYLGSVFAGDIFPVLSPMSVGSTAEFPLIAGRALYLAVRLKPAPREPLRHRFAVVPLGKSLSRCIVLPGEGGYNYTMIEDVAALFITRLFPGESVAECAPFRVTRNADMSVREDMASDLLSEMAAVLDARKKSDCVRLEIDVAVSNVLLSFLQKSLRIAKESIYRFAAPLDLSCFMRLIDLPGYKNCKNEPWTPQASPDIEPGAGMFDIIKKRDVLLVHPYESFEPVVRFIEQAANDPDVVAIKQILYRTSRNSPIVAALVRAARAGKYVTALIELKARFDEARNIEWARELETEGVQVIYGVKGLKTHAKVCMIVRREPDGLKRYLHFGTGNYNEITAQIYSDISFMTCDAELGADASAFFNAITGYSQPQTFNKIAMAPAGLREFFIELINGETERKKQGQKAFINAKMNSLVDPEIIEALYAASHAGVKVRLNVRGICCLAPGVKGLSDNITVVSIVDRMLEHSRISHFFNGGEEKVFIATADWMPRNLDKRVELVTPVEDAECRGRLVDLLGTCFKDTTNAWQLHPAGVWKRSELPSGKKAFRCQETLYKEAVRTLRQTRQRKRTAFEPYTAGETA